MRIAPHSSRNYLNYCAVFFKTQSIKQFKPDPTTPAEELWRPRLNCLFFFFSPQDGPNRVSSHLLFYSSKD
uniref:Uncharacterized protein n=1 Tax=Salix viminalis TaxID=40686 RepID=A0A6N2M9H2_SALVM